MKLVRPVGWIIVAALVLALSLPAPVTAGDCQPPSGAPTVYTVQRGDTLAKIARSFGTTAAELARLNRLANPNLIHVGQSLALPAGPGCPAAGTSAGVHVVQRGDTLSRIAARYGTTVTALAAANRIANPSRIYAGQTLVIPGSSGVTAPTPFPGLHLSPDRPQQGRTLFVSLPAQGRAGVTGSLGSWPVHFFQEEDAFVGLLGIHALAEPGMYPLILTMTDQAGTTTAYSQPIAVVDGGYARENLTLSPEKTQLLDPQLTIPERERIAAVVSPLTPTRSWEGVFQLPAAGRITSAFGTRRSYNGGPYSSYHAGVDFSASGGPDILTPAAGVVVLAEPLVVRGKATIIDHGWGVYSGFWHQSVILVQVGDVVQAGQLIGKIGATGLATGPHLHWEVFVGGVQVDPLQWTRQTFP